METRVCSEGTQKAPAPGEGGAAAAQVGQVRSQRSGVFGANAYRTGAQQTLGPRILLWEAGFVSLTLPRKKIMEGEGLRNFQELRAKFQHLDVPSLSRPIKFPAGISAKGNTGSTQSTGTLVSGTPLSSNHWRLPYCPSKMSQSLTSQKMKVTQQSERQKCSNSSEPPGISLDPAGNSQKTSLLLSVNQSNAKTGDEEKVIVANDFRDKLWNWEKVSSQKSEVSSVFLVASGGRKAFHLEEQKNVGVIAEEPRKHWEIKGAQTLSSQRPWMAKQKSLVPSEDSTSLLSHLGPDKNSDARICQPIYESELIIEVPEKQPAVRHHQLPKTKPLPSVESLGPPPAKPPKPPVVNLCAFQRQWATLPKTPREAAVEKSSLPPESAESEEPHNYEATISYLRHSGNSINLCATEEIAESIYEVEIDEPQKPWKSFLHQEHSFKHEDKDKRMKEKESHDWKLQKMEKDSHSKHPTKVSVSEETPGKDQMTNIHGGSHTLDGKQDAVTKAIHTRACPQDPKMAKHSQGHCGYADALAVTGGQGPCKPSPISEETYDDVDYPGREGSKSDFSHSLTSDNEENSGEMYEDVYKTKGNYPKIDLDGKEALNRLHRFFKKEKDKFKVKKTKSKENISSGFSISLPNLDLRSQDVTIYDDVDTNEKESKDEDKLKTWKSKFLIPKESKEKNSEESESLSPRNFFRIKKQNLKKNRMEREEKLFRERFEYDKEITVINTAVTCSSNSRNGMFDLPIITGEQLQVIDVTEENQVICRNSKGKYGYVLIEHLNFKHQGWSP